MIFCNWFSAIYLFCSGLPNMKTPMIRLSCLSASLILIFATSSVSAKQYYKWVDANGSTHYTTTPPPKTAKKKGKVDTYGWRNSAPTVATPANPADEPCSLLLQMQQTNKRHQPQIILQEIQLWISNNVKPMQL